MENRKPIHIVHCRECKGYHRINLKMSTIGIDPAPEPIPETLMDEMRKKFFRSEIRCPKTKETFIPAEDDWLHLTEQEFQALPKNK